MHATDPYLSEALFRESAWMKPTACSILSHARWVAVWVFVSFAAMAASPVDRAANDAQRAIDAALQKEPDLPRLESSHMTYDGSKLSLDDAVCIALANNVNIVRRREELRLAALGVGLARHESEPQLNGVMSSGFSNNILSQGTQQNASMQARLPQSVGLTQRLPLGGELSINAGGQGEQFESQPWIYAPTASISISQPLLRGAGFGNFYEKLFGAKRALIYNLRSFKLEEEDFMIGIVSEFLSLRNLQQQCGNLEKKLAGYEHLFTNSKALFDHSWISEIEFLRVSQERLLAENELRSCRVQLQTRLETFKLALNIPANAKLELSEDLPDYETLEINPELAVSEALAHRVDLKTAKEIVEDATRRKGLANQDILPDLSLNLSAFATKSDVLSNVGATTQNVSAYFSLNLPFDRTSERYRLFNAVQVAIRSQRELEATREIIAIEIKNSIAGIRQSEAMLAIVDAMIKSETHRHQAASIRYDQGLVSNREVIDAFNSLITFTNQRVNLFTQHFVDRLRLKRNLGELDVNRPLLKRNHQ